MSQKIFFVTGMPKSGTTLVQMLLDRHPEVSCPSEHEFSFLLRSIRYSIGAYNQVLIKKDHLTARQGSRLISDEDINLIFKSAVRRALVSAANGKTTVGAKDNNIRLEFAFYRDLFENPKFIVMLRDPRAVAVSAFRHNQRVEANFAARAGSLHNWCLQIARLWKNDCHQITSLSAADRNVHVVRYEDLLLDKKNVCRSIFSFLQVDCPDAVLDPIVAETSFERMKEASGNNPFFWQGRADSWKREISPDTNCKVQEICSGELEKFGYELLEEQSSGASAAVASTHSH